MINISSLLNYSTLIIKNPKDFQSNDFEKGNIDLWCFNYEKDYKEAIASLIIKNRRYNNSKMRLFIPSSIYKNDEKVSILKKLEKNKKKKNKLRLKEIFINIYKISNSIKK